MPNKSLVYRPRKPQDSPYYQCVEDHFEEFERIYDDRFPKKYGFLRPYLKQVIYRYLDCGILHNGFARVKCGDCGHEYLFAFLCKRRHFCPSCHQKRVVEFGEWLCEEVLKAVPHRHFVFGIPKILRRYFLYDRRLLSDLNILMNWPHSGFNVFCGPKIQPGEEKALENLARYIIRASFSQERMTYIPEESKVVYKSKDAKEERTFHGFEWLAAMASHVPNKGEQMVRYYGYYSNVSRGKRKKGDRDEPIPSILVPDSSKEYRKNWARLIQKIYETDPLCCPKCSGKMEIISVIDDEDVIKRVLKHLDLWQIKQRPPPKATGPPNTYGRIRHT